MMVPTKEYLDCYLIVLRHHVHIVRLKDCLLFVFSHAEFQQQSVIQSSCFMPSLLSVRGGVFCISIFDTSLHDAAAFCDSF